MGDDHPMVRLSNRGAEMETTYKQRHLHRIDKFKVPPAAREVFLERTRDMQAFLATLPGFVQAAVFERADGQSPFNFVSKVEWESADAIEGAKKAVNARLEGAGLNVPEMRARMGVEADTAIYAEISQTAPMRVAGGQCCHD
jgi:heme-degrading monooxygenase HmoA